jgi:hypothetical protein
LWRHVGFFRVLTTITGREIMVFRPGHIQRRTRQGPRRDSRWAR